MTLTAVAASSTPSWPAGTSENVWSGPSVTFAGSARIPAGAAAAVSVRGRAADDNSAALVKRRLRGIVQSAGGRRWWIYPGVGDVYRAIRCVSFANGLRKRRGLSPKFRSRAASVVSMRVAHTSMIAAFDAFSEGAPTSSVAVPTIAGVAVRSVAHTGKKSSIKSEIIDEQRRLRGVKSLGRRGHGEHVLFAIEKKCDSRRDDPEQVWTGACSEVFVEEGACATEVASVATRKQKPVGTRIEDTDAGAQILDAGQRDVECAQLGSVDLETRKTARNRERCFDYALHVFQLQQGTTAILIRIQPAQGQRKSRAAITCAGVASGHGSGARIPLRRRRLRADVALTQCACASTSSNAKTSHGTAAAVQWIVSMRVRGARSGGVERGEAEHGEDVAEEGCEGTRRSIQGHSCAYMRGRTMY
ncbi:hypothetical protein GGX14DRAFT_673488 [Mycena pura]|uniref:Uncharacterized protein n=1 Tax=Mycena pura TaxID=153505 RepID=A0AAD6Y2N6_9AGAR|nr:hypothetical protein GGX14DRAFT_673488 [Mycena pura]